MRMDDFLNHFSSRNIAIFAATLALVIVASRCLSHDRRLDSIPGPKGYPLIGVGYRLPRRAPTVFRQWATEYGEIFKIRVGWHNWVVINSPQAVREILEKQAAVTSSKAPSPMGHDIVTGGKRMPTMSYGPVWRAVRSAVRGLTTAPITASIIPSQEFEAKQLLFDLATDNANQRNFYQHMRRYAFSIINTSTFGTRVKDWNHPDAQNAVKSQAILRRTSRPGAFLVDEIPILSRLPSWIQPGRREATKAAADVLDIKMEMWRRLERQVVAGVAPPCYAREIFEERDRWHAQGLTEEHLAWISTGLVEAGFDTTAGTLNTLMLYLAANPRVQSKAHVEIDRKVGTERSPLYSDIAELPYVRACVKEVLRMNPILAPGIRHFTDQDVRYKDYIIPKGTVLLANTAFLHYDPSRFDKPFEFMPERYLGHELHSADYLAMGDPFKRDHFTFSMGRRSCPGARLAENSLNIALAGILWAFEVRPPIVDGHEVKVSLGEDAFPDVGFTLPKPFAVRFVPRDEKRLFMVKDQWETAQKEGYELRGMSVDVDGVVQY